MSRELIAYAMIAIAVVIGVGVLARVELRWRRDLRVRSRIDVRDRGAGEPGLSPSEPSRVQGD